VTVTTFPLYNSPVPFVQTRGQQFVLGGQPFYFAGSNTYYLTYSSNLMVDALMDATQSLGLKVIRTWAFLDMGSLDGSMRSTTPPGPKGGVYFQCWDPASAAPAYNDSATGLQHLDYVINAAAQRGLKLIMPMANNWPDFGGIDQYLAWYNLANHNDFFTDPNARQAYKNWVSHLLNRTNPLNGLKYMDDPTILAWELINEPRCAGDGPSLLNWIAEMSAFVKQTDPNHLVAVGDEGFFNRELSGDWTYDGSQGADFEAFLSVPQIDFGTFHLYPDGFGTHAGFADYWINDHIAAGLRANKPVIMEEFGIKDPAARNQDYEDWLGKIYAQDGAGDLVWMLADKQDDGTLYQGDVYTLYTTTMPACIPAHAAQMSART
jgi:mannan endo-1,4-beta-mannosidase